MARVRVDGFTVSLDGYGAGSGQTLEAPMGARGGGLHGWLRGTKTFQTMVGGGDEGGGGSTGPDNDFAIKGFENVGAWIMGRNMFGPIRGDWPDDDWKGWWGPNPPYHTPVFVLTHHPRAPLAMEGGTVFHFVAGDVGEVLAQAVAAAGGKDVRVGGGVSTVRAFLKAGLIDQMHLAVSPVLLGSGAPLLAGLDLPALGYEVATRGATGEALHVVVRRTLTSD
jgi:dihydrofolate reductase